MKHPENAILLIDDSWGIYIPQTFAERYGATLPYDDEQILQQGPDHEDYWLV